MIWNNVLLCVFGISACLVANAAARLKGEGIIGGNKAQINQFPYQVSLQTDEGNVCGGGIIADQFILTAAHCVVKRNGLFSLKPVFAVAGTNNLLDTRNAVIVEVAKIFVPTGYEPQHGSSVHDIAVLKLETPLGLLINNNIRSLDLPRNPVDTYADETAVISGFGWDWVNVEFDNRETGGNSDPELRFVVADVLTNPMCQQGYLYRQISEAQICAKAKQNFIDQPTGVCNGDSGGPLVHGNTVIGVLSTSPKGCTERDAAAVYTRVSCYLGFIDNAVMDRVTDDIRTFDLIPTSIPYERPVTSRPSGFSAWDWLSSGFEGRFN